MNNGLNASSQKINETYDNINELKMILFEIDRYVKENLRDDLNGINLNNKPLDNLSEVVRQLIFEGPRFNNTKLSFGMKLRDLLDNTTHTFRTDSLNKSLEYNRKLVSDSQIKLDIEKQRTE